MSPFFCFVVFNSFSCLVRERERELLFDFSFWRWFWVPFAKGKQWMRGDSFSITICFFSSGNRTKSKNRTTVFFCPLWPYAATSPNVLLLSLSAGRWYMLSLSLCHFLFYCCASLLCCVFCIFLFVFYIFPYSFCCVIRLVFFFDFPLFWQKNLQSKLCKKYFWKPCTFFLDRHSAPTIFDLTYKRVEKKVVSFWPSESKVVKQRKNSLIALRAFTFHKKKANNNRYPKRCVWVSYDSPEFTKTSRHTPSSPHFPCVVVQLRERHKSF